MERGSDGAELFVPKGIYVPELGPGKLAAIDWLRIAVNQSYYKELSLNMSYALDSIPEQVPNTYYYQDKTLQSGKPVFWGFISESVEHSPQIAFQARDEKARNLWQTYEVVSVVNDSKNRLTVVNTSYQGEPHHNANVLNRRTASRRQAHWLTSLLVQKYNLQ